jgi:hypothetical protein
MTFSLRLRNQGARDKTTTPDRHGLVTPSPSSRQP